MGSARPGPQGTPQPIVGLGTRDLRPGPAACLVHRPGRRTGFGIPECRMPGPCAPGAPSATPRRLIPSLRSGGAPRGRLDDARQTEQETGSVRTLRPSRNSKHSVVPPGDHRRPGARGGVSEATCPFPRRGLRCVVGIGLSSADECQRPPTRPAIGDDRPDCRQFRRREHNCPA